jgi:hypothetical protein
MQMKHPRCRQHGIDTYSLAETPQVARCLTGLVPADVTRTRLTRSSEWPWGARERRSPRPRRHGIARHGSVTRRHLSQRSSRLFGHATP